MRRNWILIAAAVALGAPVVPGTPRPPQTLPLTVGGNSHARLEWGQVFASPDDDWINDLAPLHDGNLAAVGFLNRSSSATADWRALAAEITLDGIALSQHEYGAGGGIDAFWSMAEAEDGRRMFAGFTTRTGGGGINGMVLVSRPDGTMVREQAFGGGGYDRFTDVAPAPGGYVFVGHSQLPNEETKRRAYVVRTDPEGQPLWERIFDGPESWGALYIEPSGDGGFIVAGGVSLGEADGDMFVLKIDADGRELWRKRVGTPDWDEINHGLLVRPDRTIVLVGYTNPHGSEVHDVVAATLTPDGDVKRLERFGGSGDDRAILARQEGGRVWIVGRTDSAGAGGVDLLVASLAPDGSFDPGALTVGAAADDFGTAILPLAGGALVVAGYSRNLGVGGEDAFVARLSQPDFQIAHPAFHRTIVDRP